MNRRRHSRALLLATGIAALAIGACRNDPAETSSLPGTQGFPDFFDPKPGEVWTYAVTRDFAPGSRLRPSEEAQSTELPDGAKRITFERRRICVGLERPEGAEKDLTAFALYEDGQLVEREFYDITSAGLIGRGWTPAPEITPEITPPPKGILLTPGVTIAQPHMVGGQSWSAPGINSGPLFHLDVIERATVQVPAGEFETARIRLTSNGSKRSTKRTVWFAENIGIVKEEVAHYGPKKILVKEQLVLTKWSIPSQNSPKPTPNPEPEPDVAPSPEPETAKVTDPEPIAPEPVAPEPVAPEPVAPEPVAPEPVAPEPVAPEPGSGETFPPNLSDQDPDDNSTEPDDTESPADDDSEPSTGEDLPPPPKAEIVEE